MNTQDKNSHPTASIFDGTSIVPLADVQHIEKRGIGNIMVIMKSTTYDFKEDEWTNPVYFENGEAQQFLAAWLRYRSELETGAAPHEHPGSHDLIHRNHENHEHAGQE